jgi:hypothetical protein
MPQATSPVDFSLPVSRPRTYLVAVHTALHSLRLPEGFKILGGLPSPCPGDYEAKFHARVKKLSLFLKCRPIDFSDFLLPPGEVTHHWHGQVRSKREHGMPKTTDRELDTTLSEDALVARCVRYPGREWDKKHEAVFQHAKVARPDYKDMSELLLSMKAESGGRGQTDKGSRQQAGVDVTIAGDCPNAVRSLQNVVLNIVLPVVILMHRVHKDHTYGVCRTRADVLEPGRLR